MQEFKINHFITLKLENDETVIYVDGEKFIQCSYLLLNRNIDEIKELISLESIDELELQLDKEMEMKGGEQLNIPPETEFWAHCSNMQVWAENNYNTKMLHRNLAFPLLKKLTDLGDPVAKRVFKEEIASRFESGFEPVVKFLIVQGYMEYFDEEELEIIGDNCTTLKNLDLSNWYFEKFPGIVSAMKHLQKLVLNSCRLGTLPESISNLRSLRTLSLGHNWFGEIPIVIIDLPKLETLEIYNNGLWKLPENIDNMRHIQHLSLDDNRLETVPDAIGNMIILKFLDLSDNEISLFPESFTKLFNLENLGLRGNLIESLPKSIARLNSLKALRLGNNKLTHLPDSIGKMRSLHYLWLDENHLTTLPESIYGLKSLKSISLQGNPLENKSEIKEVFTNLGVKIRI